MKYLKTIIILTVSVMSLFSCRDDDKEPEMIYIEDSPALEQITIKELMRDARMVAQNRGVSMEKVFRG